MRTWPVLLLSVSGAVVAGGCADFKMPRMWGVTSGPVRVDSVSAETNPHYTTYGVKWDVAPEDKPEVAKLSEEQMARVHEPEPTPALPPDTGAGAVGGGSASLAE